MKWNILIAEQNIPCIEGNGRSCGIWPSTGHYTDHHNVAPFKGHPCVGSRDEPRDHADGPVICPLGDHPPPPGVGWGARQAVRQAAPLCLTPDSWQRTLHDLWDVLSLTVTRHPLRPTVTLTLKALKYFRLNYGDQFEIIINVLVSSFRFIWIPMLWVYGHYKYITLISVSIDFKRQNLTSTDVRFWRLKSIHAL